MKVKELMADNPIAIGPETPLKDVAAILVEHRISGLPVISEQRTVLGVVSEADILIKEQGPEPRRKGLAGWLLTGDLPERGKLAARKSGEAMTSPAITIGPNAHVAEAARVMTEHGIKRLPVVNAEGRLVGILTRSDLVRAFARPDEEIEREIREDVVRRTLWLDGQELNVRVQRGDVMLSGELERRTDVALLPRLVARVPGVVSVNTVLTWRWDDRSVERRTRS